MFNTLIMHILIKKYWPIDAAGRVQQCRAGNNSYKQRICMALGVCKGWCGSGLGERYCVIQCAGINGDLIIEPVNPIGCLPELDERVSSVDLRLLDRRWRAGGRPSPMYRIQALNFAPFVPYLATRSLVFRLRSEDLRLFHFAWEKQ